MKRKLRIFSNIAIIALSVCMFAFGVYAASTVSVTTSGTVTFSASGVFAEVKRTVTGAKTAPTTGNTATIDASTDQDEKVPMNADLEFKTGNSLLTIAFEIKNKATDRNIYATVKNGTNIETPVSKNVKQVVEYLDTEIVISPNSSRTINIYLYVEDINSSATATYDYEIFLKSTTAGTVLTSETAEIYDNGDETCYITSITSEASHITIPEKINNLTVVGIGDENSYENIFGNDNTSLESITMANSIISIGSYSFEDCTALKYVGFSKNIHTVMANAFNNTIMPSVVVPNVYEITAYSFSSTAIKSIIIPDSVYTLTDAVIQSSPVEVLIYHGDVSSWDYISEKEESDGGYMLLSGDMFCNGERVVDISVDNSTICRQRFAGCESLRSLVFEDGVDVIGTNAFSSCTNLKSIEIPTSVTKICSGALSNVAPNCKVIYLGNKEDFANIELEEYALDVSEIYCEDGVLAL